MSAPLLRIPSLRRHRDILRYESERGWPRQPLGERLSWIRNWLIRPDRLGAECDALVWGANPILGALAAAGLASQGERVIFAFAGHKDEWDYPVAWRGMHDDLFAPAGLPKISDGWFLDLARRGSRNLTMAWGYSPTYRAGELCMMRKDRQFPGAQGESQRMASGAFEEAFGLVRKIEGTNPRVSEEMAVFAKRFIWVSDPKDKSVPVNGEFACEFRGDEQEERLGSGAWSSANPMTFAKRSREDIERALRIGGWVR